MIETRSSRKIPVDYGIRDSYKFYKDNYNSKLSRQLYRQIITTFNKEIMSLIIDEGIDYKLPELGFIISIRKDKRKVKIINGKLHNPTPVDWVTTRELWENNKEAKDKKIIVRYLNNHSSGYVYRIHFKKGQAKFKNKTIYRFKPSRMFQRMLSKRIFNDKKDKFDCFPLYNKEPK